MNDLHYFATAAGLAALICAPAALGQAKPQTDGVPDLYAVADTAWARLPAGQSWGNVIGVQPGPDGHIVVLHRCAGPSCFGRKEDPVRVFDAAGGFVRSFGSEMFVRPHGLWVDSANNIWVSDGDIRAGMGGVVYKFDKTGRVLLRIGMPGKFGAPADGMLTQPNDIITDARGDIFISEGHAAEENAAPPPPRAANAPPPEPRAPIPEANRVSVFDKDGKFLRAFGRSGSGDGEFSVPHNLAFDSQGRLFVADRANDRIELFDHLGHFITVWKQFGRPSGIYIDAGDRLYVTDSESTGGLNPGYRKGVWVGDARTGARLSFTPDIEATSSVPSGAEGVAATAGGDVLTAVVRRSEVGYLRRTKAPAH